MSSSQGNIHEHFSPDAPRVPQHTLVDNTASNAGPTCPVIHDDGVTELYSPPDKSSAIADLCFVHGLGGHPRTTWQYGNYQASPSPEPAEIAKPRKQTPFDRLFKTSKSSAGKESSQKPSNCYWPFDFLPKDFPNLRILTYGYDSHPTRFHKEATNQMTISQHSRKFLEQVTNRRAFCRSRPIVFVAHSLGGILVKDAIIESLKCKGDLNDLGLSCFACIFFGTPHHGARVADVGKRIASAMSLPTGLSVETRILDALKLESEKLDGINRDFIDLANDRSLNIYCFQEGKGMSTINILDEKIVPDISSAFNMRGFERSMTVPENHTDMCRFKSAETSPYMDFKSILLGYLDSIEVKLDKIETSQEAERQALLRSLDFDTREIRERQIQDLLTEESSFEYLWSSPFMEWLKYGSALFWISGKPGSGKSTLMNYIACSEKPLKILNEESGTNWERVHFFFDFQAGQDKRNNFEGFTRSLLVQILRQIPVLYLHLARFCQVVNADPIDPVNKPLSVTLSPAAIRDALTNSLSLLKTPLFILIDGLDEYEGNTIDLIEFIKKMCSTRVRICISCRPEPLLATGFKNNPSFAMQDHNYPGIKASIASKIQAILEDSESDEYQALKTVEEDIARKSEGVFLWARFATQELITGISTGEVVGSKALARRLEQIPQELEEIYSRIFKRSSPNTKKWAGAALLLICNANVYTFRLAVLQDALTLIPPSIVELDTVQMDELLEVCQSSEDAFTKSLLAATGGIVELYCWKPYVDEPRARPGELPMSCKAVRLIHRTVKKYLDERGWVDIFGQSISRFLGHEVWLRICLQKFVAESRTLSTGSIMEQYCQYLETRYASAGHKSFEEKKLRERILKTVPGFFDQQCTTGYFTVADTPNLLSYAILLLPYHAKTFEEYSGRPSLEYFKPFEISRCLEMHHFLMLATHGGHLCECNKLDIGMDKEDILAHNPLLMSCLGVAILHGLYYSIEKYLFQDGTAIPSPKIQPGEDSHMNLRKGVIHWAIFSKRKSALRILKLVLKHYCLVEDDEILLAIAFSSIEIVQLMLSYRPHGQLKLRAGRGIFRYFGKSMPPGESIECKPLFGIALRLKALSENDGYDVEGSLYEENLITETLIERGEDMNAFCGPSGSLLHCALHMWLNDRYWWKYQYFLGVLEWLVHKGANIKLPGPEGNALEMLWKFCHHDAERFMSSILGNRSAQNRQFALYTSQRSIIHALIDLGCTNNRPDPNGLVPSKDQMLSFEIYPLDLSFDRMAELVLPDIQERVRYYWEGPRKDTAHHAEHRLATAVEDASTHSQENRYDENTGE